MKIMTFFKQENSDTKKGAAQFWTTPLNGLRSIHTDTRHKPPNVAQPIPCFTSTSAIKTDAKYQYMVIFFIYANAR
jgi:hypothetical protein